MRKAIDDYNPDLIILEHPWLVELTEGRPYVYDAHNFESMNTAMLFGRNSMDYQMVSDIERWAVAGAEHVTYCSADDWRMMGDNWELPPGTHIPNGTHLPQTVATGENLNLIFVGSLYGPNIKAAKKLVKLVTRDVLKPPTSVNEVQPENMLFTDVVDERFKYGTDFNEVHDWNIWSTFVHLAKSKNGIVVSDVQVLNMAKAKVADDIS